MSSNKTVTDAGYRQSSNDPYKYINGSSSITRRPGEGTIITNGGRTNTYGKDLSDSFLANRLKK